MPRTKKLRGIKITLKSNAYFILGALDAAAGASII
jgi:hypothetical protein